MPPHTVPDRALAASLRHPPAFPPAWRCLRWTITPMGHLCPGQEAQVAPRNSWLTAGTSLTVAPAVGFSLSAPNKRMEWAGYGQVADVTMHLPNSRKAGARP